MEVKLVLIGRPRTPTPLILQSTFELAEDTEGLAEVQIGMEHVPLEQIPIVILRPLAPGRVVKILVALTHFPAK